MWLTNLAIKRPVVILMLFSALIVLGLRSRSGMPVDLYPKVDIPRIVITTSYPGAGPEEIETLISKPLEKAVGSTAGMKNITSYSQEGVSTVSMEFELGTNLDTAQADVRSKVDGARSQLPTEAKSPVVTKFDIGSIPILYLGMSSKRPSREMRVLAEDVVQERLGKLKGVASCNITGGDVREIQVNVDKARLEAYGVSISTIANAIQANNLNMPSGKVTEGRRDYSIRAIGEFSSPEELQNLRIHLSTGGGNNSNNNNDDNGNRVITLGDVAQVLDSVAERQQATRLQKQDSIGLLIQKQSDANTVETSDLVKKELVSMRSVLPKDVKIGVSYDQSKAVRESLEDVNVSLVLGALLAVIIVFLFLHNLRGTLIVAIAIPTSIIATFIPIFFGGFTMNMMVMLGLSLAVGILVDDSIVVLENIYRHLAKGEAPDEAALNGRSEIGLAAITITMVDVVVFVPIAFMGGIVGQFFKEFGLTVATATLFSLFVSFTLTPMLASRWYRKGEAVEAKTGFFKKFDDFYHRGDILYRGVLQWALNYRWIVVCTGFALLIAIMLLVAPMLGFEFFPRSDQGRIAVTIEMPVGTSLAATDAVASKIEDMFVNNPEVDNVFTTTGTTQSMSGGGIPENGANYAQLNVALKEKESTLDHFTKWLTGHKMRTTADEKIADEVRQKVKEIPGAVVSITTQAGGGPGGQPIDIELTGSDMNELNAAAQKVKALISAEPGIINADVSWKVGKPEVQAIIDRERAAQFHLTISDIAAALRTSIDGNTDSKYRENGREYDIRIRLNSFDRYNVSDVRRLVVGQISDQPVYLEDVATVKEATGPTKIERKNQQRKVSVTADVAQGYPVGNLQSVLDKKITEKINLGNVRLHWGGSIQDMQESFGRIGSALLLAILLVYMLMAALFESLLNPFIIMFSLPMALIGAILALAITHESMSIISQIGIIMLMGLVTKNAILLIDYTNTLRERGKERNEAVLEAGPTRLRPIMMTTLAMIFGMLPTAAKLGRGSEWRAPMAIAVIGGLIISTMLTLIMIPTMYTLFDDLVNWIRGKRRRRPTRVDFGDEEPEQPATR